MLTDKNFEEKSFTVHGDFVIDRHGAKYFPKKSKSPAKAIRLFCFECNGWDRRKKDSGKPFEFVKECVDPMCPLFDFRFGKNPFHSRAGKQAGTAYRPHEVNENLREEVRA